MTWSDLDRFLLRHIYSFLSPFPLCTLASHLNHHWFIQLYSPQSWKFICVSMFHSSDELIRQRCLKSVASERVVDQGMDTILAMKNTEKKQQKETEGGNTEEREKEKDGGRTEMRELEINTTNKNEQLYSIQQSMVSYLLTRHDLVTPAVVASSSVLPPFSLCSPLSSSIYISRYSSLPPFVPPYYFIRVLKLNQSNIIDSTLLQLAFSLPYLQRLVLRNCIRLTLKAFTDFPTIPADATNSPLIRSNIPFPSLTNLDLAYTSVSNESLACLLPHLSSRLLILRLCGCQLLHRYGFKEIRRCEKLISLKFALTMFDDAAAVMLFGDESNKEKGEKEEKQEKQLQNDEEMKYEPVPNSLPFRCPLSSTLTHLNIIGCRRISRFGFDTIVSSLPHLASLWMRGVSSSSSSSSSSLSSSSLSSSTLPPLSHCISLQELSTSGEELYLPPSYKLWIQFQQLQMIEFCGPYDHIQRMRSDRCQRRRQNPNNTDVLGWVSDSEDEEYGLLPTESHLFYCFTSCFTALHFPNLISLSFDNCSYITPSHLYSLMLSLPHLLQLKFMDCSSIDLALSKFWLKCCVRQFHRWIDYYYKKDYGWFRLIEDEKGELKQEDQNLEKEIRMQLEEKKDAQKVKQNTVVAGMKQEEEKKREQKEEIEVNWCDSDIVDSENSPDRLLLDKLFDCRRVFGARLFLLYLYQRENSIQEVNSTSRCGTQ